MITEQLELFKKEPSRIDIIGQNGNDGLHYLSYADLLKENAELKETIRRISNEHTNS